MVFKLLQVQKALLSIFVTLDGISTDSNDSALVNKPYGISVIDNGNFTALRFLQFLNVSLPKLTTESGREILESELQPINALVPIVLTLFGMRVVHQINLLLKKKLKK